MPQGLTYRQLWKQVERAYQRYGDKVLDQPATFLLDEKELPIFGVLMSEDERGVMYLDGTS